MGQPKINAVVCLVCGEILVSTHVHDFKQCSCDNKAMVDGGNDYVRCGAADLMKIANCTSMEEATRISKSVHR